MTTTTPIDRLRGLHQKSKVHHWCTACKVPMPCDTIAALDALGEQTAQEEAEVVSLRARVQRQRDRLDAATVLIRQAMKERHTRLSTLTANGYTRSCGASLSTPIDTCPECAPLHAWLAGDKEEHGE